MIPRRPVRHLSRITLAGSLCMVFIGCVLSPVITDIFRQLGATEVQFGLLAGLPMAMLFMQFIGATWTNRLRHRRTAFMTLNILARLLFLPIALLPCLPGLAPATVITAMIALIALYNALQNLTLPMWLSWMSDLIPRRILSRYWGGRQRYITLTTTLIALTVTALTFYGSELPLRPLFLGLSLLGVTAGVIDILLFRSVREPPNLRTNAHPLHTLLEPLRDRNYRSIVRFSVIWTGASMLAASFMLIYTLDVLKVPLWKTSLLWCMPGIGAAIVAPLWGRLVDRYGSRPILRVCVFCKPMIVVAFLLVTPDTAMLVLAPALLFDNMLNMGIEIAMNGFMLKLAPRENRGMFIAAISALSGLAGAVGAITGGIILRHTNDFHTLLFGREWNHYQLLFLTSLLLRLPCNVLARRIREPASAPSRMVLNHLLTLWPLRVLAFPVSLYRRLRGPEA